MRSILTAVGLCLMVAASAAAQDKAKGAQLFVDQKCTLCHSVAGKGNAKGSLDGVGSKNSAADIRNWLLDAKAMYAKTKQTRKPEMKQYTLAKDDVDALVAYLSSLKDRPADAER